MRLLQRCQLGLVVFLGGGMCFPAAGGSVIHVDDDALPGGDGATWDTAFRFLKDALAHASNPGNGVAEIRVARGTYQPDRGESDPGGTGDRDATFELMNGVAILGGYSGIGSVDPDDRDVVMFEAILSGDLNGDDGDGFEGNGENSYTVVIGSGTDGSAVLDGFTITAGNADCDGVAFAPCFLGGGMLNDNGSPTLLRCSFVSNWARYGGGIYNRSSSPVITECVFADNQSEWAGGGIRNNQSSNPPISGCVFSGNHADTGGGLASQTSSVVDVSDSVFIGNTAVGPAGGIHGEYGPAITLARCTFAGNTAVGAGGMFAAAET